MALNIYNIRKWYRMLSGKSIMHVNQDLGKFFDVDNIKGYYNNLTEKVSLLPHLLETKELPKYEVPTGEKVTFPVDVFQYGLGAFDLFLMTNDQRYYDKFMQCVFWTIENQEDTGAWNTFFFKYPNAPYGGMAQGEAASLLVRAYIVTNDEEYLNAAKRAIDFMLRSRKEGGCTDYLEEGKVIFCEYTHLPVVLNGWIFAWFGLFDYVKVSNDNSFYKGILNKSKDTLIDMLPKFSTKYWSLYDIRGNFASPFYHRLHIAQLEAMYAITSDKSFLDYSRKWDGYLHNTFYKCWAFVRKAWQKIFETEYWT